MRTLAAYALALSAISLTAQAAWVDADVADIRIEVDPSWAAGKEIVKVVRRNDASIGAQSDAVQFGKSALPGPLGWLTYQTNSQNFKYEAAMDAIRGSNATFKGADFPDSARSSFKASTVFGEVEVTKFDVVLKGMKRQCATWRDTFSGNSVLVTGFLCGSQDQPLADADVIAALSALKKKG
jgi:hypothetical protein